MKSVIGRFFLLNFSGGDMIVYVVEQKRYGFWKFVGDCLMTIFTWGFWLIWVFVREMRKRKSRYSYFC